MRVRFAARVRVLGQNLCEWLACVLSRLCASATELVLDAFLYVGEGWNCSDIPAAGWFCGC